MDQNVASDLNRATDYLKDIRDYLELISESIGKIVEKPARAPLTDAELEAICVTGKENFEKAKAAGLVNDPPPPAKIGPLDLNGSKPYTNEQLKTVSVPFKTVNQTVLISEVLKEMNFIGVSTITKRPDQDRYLLLVKDKSTLLPQAQHDAVINAINILTIGV
jgi:hypothetical protein